MSQAAAANNLAPDQPANAKRDSIIAGATQVFLSVGYGAATMDAIAKAANVSKQTVYAHFGAKDSLFEAIIRQKCDDLLAPAVGVELSGNDVAAVLGDIADRFINAILSPDNMSLFRAIVGECTRFPELADAFYRAGPRLAADVLADYLAEASAEGAIRVDNPTQSAEMFFAMLRGDFYMRRVLAMDSPSDPDEIAGMIARSVTAFMAAHAKP